MKYRTANKMVNGWSVIIPGSVLSICHLLDFFAFLILVISVFREVSARCFRQKLVSWETTETYFFSKSEVYLCIHCCHLYHVYSDFVHSFRIYVILFISSTNQVLLG